MTPDARRRLAALEHRTPAAAEQDAKASLRRLLGLDREPSPLEPRWEHFDPVAVELETRQRIADTERRLADALAEGEALAAGTAVWPTWCTTDAQRRAYRDSVASRISNARLMLKLMEPVERLASFDAERPVDPHPAPALLPDLHVMSNAELFALAAARHAELVADAEQETTSPPEP